MSRPRKTPRLTQGQAPMKVLQAVELLGGTMHIAEYRSTVNEHCATVATADDCCKRLVADGMIEVYVHITQRGRDALAAKLKKATTCVKPARTVARKATAPTAAPIDSTPLAMAWMMGRHQ